MLLEVFGMHDYINLFYLVAAVLFIVALKMLTSPKTARLGNQIGAIGMLIAIVGTLAFSGIVNYSWIVIGVAIGAAVGAVLALYVKMTAMPQMVSIFNGSGGVAAALVAVVEFWGMSHTAGSSHMFAMSAGLSAVIGSITFTGSILAAGKL